MLSKLTLCAALASLPLTLAADPATLRGKLSQGSGGRPALVTASEGSIFLEGDADTMKVLADRRLHGTDFEVTGERLAANRFRVGPFHTKSMWVLRDGKRLLITYWCAVCSIRAYVPGLCQCCQEETELDLLESPAVVHAY